ncbi:MAG: 2-oxoglutarate dehydrogenase complex dihydrolipoyllysine-residue succinyltransferase [Phycisphaerales bacterium]|nr:2-oxoglutarate dehydrogenase complex dihydrolipoyllysine-residue succinyltransferase [Phycisphaerales bacterium]
MSTEIVIPNVGESVTSGVISAWSVEDGAYVERDQTVLELETDKVTMEVPAPASGVVKHSASEGDEVDVGAVVGSIDESAAKPADSGGGSAPEPKAESKPAPAASSGASGATAVAAAPAKPNASVSSEDVKATPLARKLAEDKGVDLGSVNGTGAGGRIREQDVLAALQSNGKSGAGAMQSAVLAGPTRTVTTERMSPMRQRIASRLVEAQQTAAMLTTFNEVDMGAVMDLRKLHKDAFSEKHGVNLGFMSFFVKACTQALDKFPKINSYITAGSDGKPAVQNHDYADVAIAVSGPKGLVVPVLRNAESMSFAGIESSIKDMAIRARDGKLGLEEMQGGTFTITNGGIFGSLMSTPILNPPQSAILGMHGIKKRAVEYPVGSGQIALRPMMYLALSYDHRIVDGAEAVQFLVSIKDAIEDPARLMLEL